MLLDLLNERHAFWIVFLENVKDENSEINDKFTIIIDLAVEMIGFKSLLFFQ